MTASCTFDEMWSGDAVLEGEEVVMTFAPSFQDFESVTKTIGDASQVDQLLVHVYEEGSKEYNDYWCAFLGWKGSNILDEGRYNDDEYRYSEDWEKNKLYLKPSLDFCEETYEVTDWVDCKDVEVKI